jgi:2-amino-4-hydroxy-6-hydroxymethyldihydropteridine diphosphokinase
MPRCLLGLGSNLGDREQTLEMALTEIDALPDVRLVRRSNWHRSEPVGGPPDQPEFLNGAAVFETSTPPLPLLSELQQIEARHGRVRRDHWSPRTLDIDILLYDTQVAETDMLTLPHPRLSFRRFVLEPAAEVAPRMLHPTIGWPVERLLLHLNAASELAAIVSPSESVRTTLGASLVKRFGGGLVPSPTFATAEHLWPRELTTWMALRQSAAGNSRDPDKSSGLSYAAADFPKLSILIDGNDESPAMPRSHWSAVVRRPGRGPTLRLQTPDPTLIEQEAFSAFEAVWPI